MMNRFTAVRLIVVQFKDCMVQQRCRLAGSGDCYVMSQPAGLQAVHLEKKDSPVQLGFSSGGTLLIFAQQGVD
jgi:hypothetical protein